MRSRRSPITWLLIKEWRELMSSRAWWLMLALVGPIVGVCFIDGVRSFAEVSAGAGAGCGMVCAPLIGIWGPTFGAYEIVAVFLLPFVVIRLVSGDRQSGAMKLELQRPLSPFVRVGVKAVVLVAAWVLTFAGAAIAIGLWAGYGGAVYAPEVAVIALGHIVNATVTIGLAAALGAMAEHPSTAAIATLGFTIGTWIINFAAAIHGGIWQRLAAWTPSAMISSFQHGLLRADVLLAGIVLSAAGLAIAANWIRLGPAPRVRIVDTIGILATAAIVVGACGQVRASWDSSESRQNSFAEPEEEALARIPGGLAIEVHLAPQDIRRVQLERSALAKLERAMPDVKVTYAARTASGLFEQQDPGYGEIRYAMGDRRTTSRVVTDEGVLEAIFEVAGTRPPEDDDAPYNGHPLNARPTGAAWTFYGLWPAVVGAVGYRHLRRMG